MDKVWGFLFHFQWNRWAS